MDPDRIERELTIHCNRRKRKTSTHAHVPDRQPELLRLLANAERQQTNLTVVGKAKRRLVPARPDPCGQPEPVAPTAIGAGTPALAKFDSKGDKRLWSFKKP